jgi:hypothetical protein
MGSIRRRIPALLFPSELLLLCAVTSPAQVVPMLNLLSPYLPLLLMRKFEILGGILDMLTVSSRWDAERFGSFSWL